VNIIDDGAGGEGRRIFGPVWGEVADGRLADIVQ